MTIGENLKEFDGKPVVDFSAGMALDPDKNVYRIRWEYGGEMTFAELFADFVSSDGVERVTGLITGAYSEEMYDEPMAVVLEAVLGSASQLPNLSGLFLADMTFDEFEISWIQQTDVSPLWTAFPRLRTLGIRGGEGLNLGNVVHDQLQSLTIESGGLGRGVIAQVVDAKLPELTHLEVWTGSDNYGGDSSVDDVRPLMEAERFPKLKYLGLKNSEYQNDIAKAVIDSTILPQLETLDLSMGTLTDEGAEALLAHPDRLAHLQLLDLSHHFLTAEIQTRLTDLPCKVDVSDEQEADVDDDEVYRYIAVAE